MKDEDAASKILDYLSTNPKSSKRQIMDALWLSDRKVSYVLRQLRNEGKIVIQNRKYAIKTTKTSKVTTNKKHREKPIYDNVYIVRIVLGLISIGATIMSIRFTAIFQEAYLPTFWAWFLSVLMISFTVSAFTMGVYFIQHKNIPMGIIIFILWGMVIFYSMMSTVVVFYNERKDEIYAHTNKLLIDNNADSLYTQYTRDIEVLQVLIKNKQDTLDRYNKLIVSYDTIEKRDANKKDYTNLSWAISEAEKFIQSKTAEMNVIVIKKERLLDKKEGNVNIPSFYEQMEAVFHISAWKLEFFINCFASVFIDIISSLGASLALMMRRKHE